MNFENFITSHTGLLHFIASLFTLIFGTLILVLPKGTVKHKVIGRLYVITMLILLITAFMIYRLFGKWGVFHWTAVISSLTLVAGFLPVLFKRPVNNYISLHFSFMFWSVIGVFGAFVSEILVRIPKIVVVSGIPQSVFYNMTGIGTAIIMALGTYYFLKFKPKWSKQFERRTNEIKQ